MSEAGLSKRFVASGKGVQRVGQEGNWQTERIQRGQRCVSLCQPMMKCLHRQSTVFAGRWRNTVFAPHACQRVVYISLHLILIMIAIHMMCVLCAFGRRKAEGSGREGEDRRKRKGSERRKENDLFLRVVSLTLFVTVKCINALIRGVP